MDIPALPQPTGGDYGTEILATLGTILLIVVGVVVREYLKSQREAREYRDKREAADLEFRDKQIATQEQHYKDVAASRDAFRANYEANTNARLDGFESAIKTLSTEFRDILEKQQSQISALDKQLYGLNHKSPKAGE